MGSPVCSSCPRCSPRCFLAEGAIIAPKQKGPRAHDNRLGTEKGESPHGTPAKVLLQCHLSPGHTYTPASPGLSKGGQTPFIYMKFKDCTPLQVLEVGGWGLGQHLDLDLPLHPGPRDVWLHKNGRNPALRICALFWRLHGHVC